MEFFSQAFLVFPMKESKKRRREQPAKIDGSVSFTAGQFVRCPALNEPLGSKHFICIFIVQYYTIEKYFIVTD